MLPDMGRLHICKHNYTVQARYTKPKTAAQETVLGTKVRVNTRMAKRPLTCAEFTVIMRPAVHVVAAKWPMWYKLFCAGLILWKLSQESERIVIQARQRPQIG